MSFLDKVGKAAMDAVDRATDAVDKVQKRVDPLIDKSPLAKKLRDRIAQPEDDDVVVPEPENHDSPFAPPEPEPEPELADAAVAAQVFGPGTDPWTGRSRQLLTDHGVEHTFVDLESDEGVKLEARLVRETEQTSPPYVFLRGEFVGGYNALNEIVRLGQIEEMIKTPEERAKSGNRTRIVITKRTEDDRPPGES